MALKRVQISKCVLSQLHDFIENLALHFFSCSSFHMVTSCCVDFHGPDSGLFDIHYTTKIP